MISRRAFMVLTTAITTASFLNTTKTAFGTAERSVLHAGEHLNNGEVLISENGLFKLGLQSDGNLVLYRLMAAAYQARWASGTNGHKIAHANMQGDGNLVLRGPDGSAVWATGTEGNPGAFLQIQNDGNVVIYSANHKALWATDTVENHRVAHAARDEMEFTVKVSRTGIVETTRYAGIKRQSGTYHHYFWFALLDGNEDTLWILREPLHLTIGAVVDTIGRPSFVSKTEHAVLDVPVEYAQSFAKIAIYMDRQKTGYGSPLEQIKEADRIYKTLKNLEVIKDLITVIAAS
ncbi:MAG: hypothetical protein U0350_14560 [Caldilineaceae bacterium]